MAGSRRTDEATRILEAGILVARLRGLDYELGLLLADLAPLAPSAPGLESPASESARLLSGLGVVSEVDDDAEPGVELRPER